MILIFCFQVNLRRKHKLKLNNTVLSGLEIVGKVSTSYK
jgi:hypothetical protein